MSVLIRNNQLEVTVTPERGADITRLTDRQSGIQVFAESPTGQVTASSIAPGSSQSRWLSGYPGGWQLLVPNAGTERVWDGATQGFHGEASLAKWKVIDESTDWVELETFLFTAPLHLQRTVNLEGPRLRVADRVTNLAPNDTKFRWGQHPAFGHHFLDDESYLEIFAGRFLADAENSGTLATPQSTGLPADLLPQGPKLHTIALPGPGSQQSLSGAFTDFPVDKEGGSLASVVFVSPSARLSARVSWNTSVHPHAWFWIEAHSVRGWPWFQRLYAIAVEPSNILPGEGPGPAGLVRGGPGVALEAGGTLTSEITIELESLP